MEEQDNLCVAVRSIKAPSGMAKSQQGVDRDFSATAEVKPLQLWSSEERRRTVFGSKSKQRKISK
ncbi:MAG: hypothetical protein HFJ29_08840 [Clostridia bacterium]|nr:hypothetical protein [Clostridia bacterium]